MIGAMEVEVKEPAFQSAGLHFNSKSDQTKNTEIWRPEFSLDLDIKSKDRYFFNRDFVLERACVVCVSFHDNCAKYCDVFWLYSSRDS